MNLFKKCVAELIGTAILCFAACGVAVVTSYSVYYYSVWWIATSLAFGLVIVAMAYSIGNISGCHINPAVSLAMFISGKMTFKEFLAYVGAQIVGAFIGSTLLGLCLHNLGGFTKLGGNTIQIALLVNNDSLNAWSYIGAFIVELILTFIFVLTILGVTDSKFHDGKLAGLVIGGSLTLVHLIGLGFTGTSVNPARSLAPAVLQAIAGDTTSLSQVWIWILAPLAGGALAALVYKFLAKTKEKKAEVGPKAE
jgi:aquaporin Z